MQTAPQNRCHLFAQDHSPLKLDLPVARRHLQRSFVGEVHQGALKFKTKHPGTWTASVSNKLPYTASLNSHHNSPQLSMPFHFPVSCLEFLLKSKVLSEVFFYYSKASFFSCSQFAFLCDVGHTSPGVKNSSSEQGLYQTVDMKRSISAIWALLGIALPGQWHCSGSARCMVAEWSLRQLLSSCRSVAKYAERWRLE